MNNFFNNLYTIIEIAIHQGLGKEDLARIRYYIDEKNISKLIEKYPVLEKFIPYCNWYVKNDKNILAMSAYLYDLYTETGLLPDYENYDINPDTNKLEYWQYINPLVFEINPETDFEFAKNIYPDCNIWSLFLAGCARMDYYQEENITLEQRIKFAIVEYMARRSQFFSTEDFVDNPILHKKYKKRREEENGEIN